jgi:hypothetical protein
MFSASTTYTTILNSIGGVMVSVFASIAEVHGFEHWSGQTKDYKIGICCFSDSMQLFKD